MNKIDLSVLETGYHRLLKAIFGYTYKVVFKDINELLSAIQEGLLLVPISSEVEQAVSMVLSTLTEREADVIRRRFGIERDRETLKEISISYDVSSSAIGQTERRAKNKLRHPVRSRHLNNINVSWYNILDRANLLSKQIEKRDIKIEEMNQRISGLERENLAIEKCRQAAKLLHFLISHGGEDKRIALLDKPVSELELSVRNANCLEVIGVVTVRDLVVKTEAEMLNHKHYGKISLNELKVILNDMGLSFGMVLPEDQPNDT